MTNIRGATALCCVIAITACAGIDVKTDYDPDFDFEKLETYRWAPDFVPAGGPLIVDSDLIHSRIRSAIESQLGARGFRAQTDPTPDVWVAYHIGIDRKIEVDTIYHRNAGWGRRGYSRRGYGQSSTYVREYVEGTLLIDLLRPGSGDLLWRGSAISRVKERKTPEERTKAIDDVVAKILEKLR